MNRMGYAALLRSYRSYWLILVVLLLGCHRTHQPSASGAVLRYPLSLEPATLDPACINETPTLEMLQNVYEGLVTFDANNQVVPLLAERWDISSDGRTYTFHLRRARFHNGRELVSADFKYSVERALRPETRSGVAANYLGGIVGVAEVATGQRRDVSGIQTPDPRTVVIRLDRPRGYFLGMLAYPTGWVVCHEAIEKNGGRLDENAAVGTGPFRLTEYRHGAKLVLAANPDYWGGRPKLDGIERPIVKDPQTAHIMFENGELDMTGVAPGDFLRDRADPKLSRQLELMPAAVTLYAVLHPRLEPAFRDRRVRLAIAMAIDRKEMTEVASHGIWTPAYSFLPPGFPGYSRAFRPIPSDPPRARQLLAEAGFPGGRGFPKLTLVFSQGSPELAALAQIMRDQLRANLGITIDLQQRESATLRTDVFAQKVAFCLTDWGPDYIDPQNFLSMLLRTNAKLNFCGYSNARFDALCDRADSEPDMAKRLPLYQQADQIAMDDVAVLPLYYGSTRLLVKPYVRDWQRNLMSFLPQTKTRIDMAVRDANGRK